MGGAKAEAGVNNAEWVKTKNSSPVGVPKHSRAIFSKVGLQVDQLSKQKNFPIIPQLQHMIYNFLALSLCFYPM